MSTSVEKSGLRLQLFGTPALEAVSLPAGALENLDNQLANRSHADRAVTMPIKVSRRKSLALLAYLATTKKRSRRETLTTLLWPDTAPDLAQSYMRRELAVLNRALGEGWLLVDRESIGLSERAGWWLDVEQFRGNIALAGRHDHPASEVCPRCMPLLSDAKLLYTGDFMTGFSFRDSPDFDEWRFFEAEQLRNDMAGVLARLVQGYSAQRQFQTAIDVARLWLELSPWHEPAHQALMRLYVWSGNEVAALRQYATCVNVLESEMGLAPGVETERLYAAVKDNQIPLPFGGLFAGQMSLNSRPDAGNGDPVSPPAPSAEKQSAVANDPFQFLQLLPPFVGRKLELAKIRQLLTEEPACRILTLVGPSGIGKTRLAFEAADQTQGAFLSGTYIVRLGEVDSVPMLIQAIADAMDFRFESGGNLLFELVDFLRHKSALLILDSFENLFSDSTTHNAGQHAAVTDFLLELLSAAPAIKLLVTSLGRIGLQAEWVQSIDGLPYPTTEELSAAAQLTVLPEEGKRRPKENELPPAELNWRQYDAVALFLRQAERLLPQADGYQSERQAIVRICQLVEGSPLALELAAAWLRVMSPHEIATELYRSLLFLPTTLPYVSARHRSLAALFHNTWELLADEERASVRRLAGLRGGFTREAALQIAQVDLTLLATLIDKSLLRKDRTMRYQMHEILRQFAYDRLTQMADEFQSVLLRHISFFATLLCNQEAALQTDRRRTATAMIALDIDNIRAAWRHAIEQRQFLEIDVGLQGLYQFYIAQEWIVEGERMMGDALAALPALPAGLALSANEVTDQPPRDFAEGTVGPSPSELGLLRSRLLVRYGHFAFRLAQYARASAALTDCLDLIELLGPEAPPEYLAEKALALRYLGAIQRKRGAYSAAEAHYRTSLAIFDRLENPSGIAGTLQHLAIAIAQQARYQEAQQLFLHAHALYSRLDNPYGVADAENNLGIIAERMGEPHLARMRHMACLATRRQLNDVRGISASLNNLGYVESQLGNFTAAETYLLEGLSILKDLGQREALVNCLSNLGALYVSLEEYRTAADYYLEALQIAKAMDALPLVLEVVDGITEIQKAIPAGGASLQTSIYAFIMQYAIPGSGLHRAAAEKLKAVETGLAPSAYLDAVNYGHGVSLEEILTQVEFHLTATFYNSPA